MPYNPPSPTDAGLPSRLQQCAARMGGKRALARAAGLSEAQLFRYLNGESDMAVSKLSAIAGAANVNVAWLLTGEEQPIVVPDAKPAEPAFNPVIMETLTQQLDELLIEYQQRLTPKQRARGLTFLYQALRQDELTHGAHTPIDRRLLLEVLEYFDHFRNDISLDIYRGIWCTNGKADDYLLAQFTEITCKNIQNEYDGFSGKSYFSRMTFQAPPSSVARLTNLAAHASQLAKTPRLLDIGAGNGRELSFVHGHFPHITLKGIELSTRGVTLSRQLETKGKLPEGCLIQGSCLNLPFDDASFEAITSRLVFNWLPYQARSAEGVSQAFAEMSRVMVVGGMASLVLPYGAERYTLPFNQCYTHDMLEDLASQHGLVLKSYHPHDVGSGLSQISKQVSRNAMTSIHTTYEAVLSKA